MNEKNKTIDGMSVRRAAARRRVSGIDGLRPATGTKTTVSREVRMRQAEKVLREREARERIAREARIRTARIEAAQLRTARDTSVKPVAMRGNVYSQPTRVRRTMETRKPIERTVVTRPLTMKQKTIEPKATTESSKPERRLGADFKAKSAVTKSFVEPVAAFDGLEDRPARKRMNLKRKEDDMVKTPEEKRPKLKKTEGPEKVKKKKSGFWKWFRRIFILLILGGIAFGFAWSNGLISKITGGQSGIFDAISAVLNPDVELKKGSNGRTNVLVFGTSGYEMDGSGHDGAQLTDSIMVVSFEKETSDVVMVNLPRDLYVGNTCTATGKVNEVYWCANMKDEDEAAGAAALQAAVAKILGVETQYYVHINWGALVQVVDALGGVTVTLDEDIADNWTKTYIKAGVPTALGGEAALGLARARHGTEQGDFSRGASQQKLLMALVARVLEEKIDVGQALGLVSAIGDNLRSNFSLEEIKSIVHLVADIDLANMRQVALTSTDGSKDYLTFSYMPVGGIDISYVVPSAGTSNYTAIQKLIAQEFSSDLATREKANILVLNGSGISGAASRERSTLEDNGFTVGEIGDAPDGEYPSAYYLYDITARCPGTLASLQKRYNITASSAETIPEGIDSSRFDFVLVIGAGGE